MITESPKLSLRQYLKTLSNANPLITIITTIDAEGIAKTRFFASTPIIYRIARGLALRMTRSIDPGETGRTPVRQFNVSCKPSDTF